MFQRIALLIVIVSNTAIPVYAASSPAECPNLTGSFRCTDGNTTTISQRVADGVVIYTLNGTEVPADGKLNAVGDNSDFQGQQSYTCTQGSLVRALTMFVPVWADTAYARDAQGNLTIQSSLITPAGTTDQGTETCQEI